MAVRIAQERGAAAAVEIDDPGDTSCSGNISTSRAKDSASDTAKEICVAATSLVQLLRPSGLAPVAQQLDMRRRAVREEAGDLDDRAWNRVQPFLLHTFVEGAAALDESEPLVEGEARSRLVDGERGMIEAEARKARRLGPIVRHLAFGKLQKLERMSLRILELVGDHAAGRCGQGLRPGR